METKVSRRIGWREVEKDEVMDALKKRKVGKRSGLDGIAMEEQKYGGKMNKKMVAEDWAVTYITSVYKRRGDRGN